MRQVETLRHRALSQLQGPDEHEVALGRGQRVRHLRPDQIPQRQAHFRVQVPPPPRTRIRIHIDMPRLIRPGERLRGHRPPLHHKTARNLRGAQLVLLDSDPDGDPTRTRRPPRRQRHLIRGSRRERPRPHHPGRVLPATGKNSSRSTTRRRKPLRPGNPAAHPLQQVLRAQLTSHIPDRVRLRGLTDPAALHLDRMPGIVHLPLTTPPLPCRNPATVTHHPTRRHRPPIL